jgi:phage tail-like protein
MPGTLRDVSSGSTPDPVAELRFHVKLGSLTIGRFQECTGIAVEIEMKDYMEGGVNDYVHKLPTRVKYPNLVLKRGMTTKSDLQRWFQKSHTQAERTTISLTMLDQGGETMRTWSFENAYPIKWTGPNFNAAQSALAVEQIEIAHEGMRPVA